MGTPGAGTVGEYRAGDDDVIVGIRLRREYAVEGEEVQVRDANQAAQRVLVERGRAMPGVAALMDIYGRIADQTGLMMNVQPSQVRNAVGANGS